MKYGYVLLVCLWLLPVQVYAQRENKKFELVARHATIVMPDYSIELHFLNKERNIHVKSDKQYAWYKGNKVMWTRGGFDGKVLDGPYKEFYLNKNLKTSGNYSLGLKKGQWDTWFSDGEHCSIEHWRKGHMHGSFKEFDQSGAIIKQGRYSNGLQTGKWKELQDGQLVITKWKAGKEVVKKEKLVKEKNNSGTKEATGKKKFGARLAKFWGNVKHVFHPHPKDGKQGNQKAKQQPKPTPSVQKNAVEPKKKKETK